MMDEYRRTIAILVFDDVELLDFAGPFEVFSSVRALTGDHDRLLEVFAVAEQGDPLRCRNGLTILPACTIYDCPPFDILCVPGGYGTRAVCENLRLLDWIRERSAQAELITSVCTGSFVLAAAGVLAETPVTTHWESIGELRAAYPRLEVREDERWVDAGRIITSAGVSAGIDMALHLVARLYGTDVARATALGIEYDYWN
ncbi:MAG TPA: DJ-1/PfpI family protein [Roseiflexaceae bacterium]|nr:DJ-1/PfpI family protein [Roseiflexaceae bacterium]HMP39271.1 DJ-1/PfpI family protein [Roseiflexaceae bacterium]